MRDVVVVEELEDRAEGERPLCLGLADDDRDIGGEERVLRLPGELDRAGAVEEGPGVAEEARRRRR
jgi:hypothetical protein